MKLAAWWILLLTVVFADGEGRWSDLGRAPLVVRVHDPAHLSAQNCRSCHDEVYADWAKSRHAAAWDNPIFQEGYLVETQDRCLHCHTPLREQFREVKGTGELRLAREGVNCAVCHVRDGAVYSTTGDSDQWHPLRTDVHLKSPQFCARCHQFNVNGSLNGQVYETEVVAQNTYKEWLNYQARGGRQSCQQCHMPGGRHLFHGAHNDRMLRSALRVEPRERDGKVEFQIEAVNIGHNLPTGDVFRQLSFEVRPAGKGEFVEVRRFGRKFELGVGSSQAPVQQRLVEDASLRPFEPVIIATGLTPPVEFRLRYHFVSEKEKTRSHLPARTLTTTVLSGRADHSTLKSKGDL